jgi:GNAT superfamily N-acetyltransferase
MAPEVRVRDAIPDDTETIVSLTAAGWQTAYQGIVPRERLADLPVDRWRHEVSVGLRRPVADAFTYAAEIDDRLVGYCYVAAPARDADLGDGEAELAAIYVDPARWRQGVGGTLMRAALDRMGELGYGEGILWTFKQNRPAISFYERHGWSADGAERVHPRAGAVAVRYRHLIARPAPPAQ